MASPTFSDVVLRKEVRRLRQQKTSFVNFCSRDYEGEIKGKTSVVFVPVMTNITLAASNITGTVNNTLGTGPGQAITASNSTFSLEPLTLGKYAPYREQMTEFQMRHSKIAIESSIADNLATAQAVIMDNFVRDLVLVDKVAAIPAANKLNSAAPITVTTANVVSAFGALVVALDVQNAPETRVLFVSPAVAGVYFQSNILTNTDDGLQMIMKGYIGQYRGIKIVQTNALTASNEMIMMSEDAVNFVMEDYALETRDATDGKYTNLISELVYGGNIFTTNLVNVAIQYCV